MFGRYLTIFFIFSSLGLWGQAQTPHFVLAQASLNNPALTGLFDPNSLSMSVGHYQSPNFLQASFNSTFNDKGDAWGFSQVNHDISGLFLNGHLATALYTSESGLLIRAGLNLGYHGALHQSFDPSTAEKLHLSVRAGLIGLGTVFQYKNFFAAFAYNNFVLKSSQVGNMAFRNLKTAFPWQNYQFGHRGFINKLYIENIIQIRDFETAIYSSFRFGFVKWGIGFVKEEYTYNSYVVNFGLDIDNISFNASMIMEPSLQNNEFQFWYLGIRYFFSELSPENRNIF